MLRFLLPKQTNNPLKKVQKPPAEVQKPEHSSTSIKIKSLGVRNHQKLHPCSLQRHTDVQFIKKCFESRGGSVARALTTAAGFEFRAGPA